MRCPSRPPPTEWPTRSRPRGALRPGIPRGASGPRVTGPAASGLNLINSTRKPESDQPPRRLRSRASGLGITRSSGTAGEPFASGGAAASGGGALPGQTEAGVRSLPPPAAAPLLPCEPKDSKRLKNWIVTSTAQRRKDWLTPCSLRSSRAGTDGPLRC